jgi:hypothetical protein
MEAPDEKFIICKTCGQTLASTEPQVVCNPIREAQDEKQPESAETIEKATPSSPKKRASKK